MSRTKTEDTARLKTPCLDSSNKGPDVYGSRVHVLVVEDNPGDFVLIKELCHDFSDIHLRFTNVHRFRDLVEVLEGNDRPNVVLLDLELPDCHGAETLRRASELRTTVPIIILSGSDDGVVMEESMTYGFEDFIRKGEFDGEQLNRRIRFALTRYRRNDALFRRANFDSLTKVATRGLFNDRLSHGLDRTERTRDMLGLMLIDVDDFKNVNDTYGHDAGDIVLTEIARRLASVTRQSDTVGRLSGDEFALVLEGIPYRQAVNEIAAKVVSSMEQPILIGSASIKCSISVGVAIYDPSAGRLAGKVLMKQADIALYRAKMRGKGTFVMHSDVLNREVAEEVRFDQELHDALDKHEFVPFFQPIVQASDNKLRAVEMLLRWEHPHRGTVLPASLIPALQRMNMLGPVAEQVLRLSLNQFRGWLRNGLQNVQLAINVDAKQLAIDGFAKSFEAVLRDCSIEPHDLQIEITEDHLLEGTVIVERNLQHLKWLGIDIVIDDFGMRHASFDYLKRFSVAGLKVDKSVTTVINTNPIDFAIAKSIVSLARDTGCTVTIEGVETRPQHDTVLSLDPHFIQGFSICRPLSGADLSKKLNLKTATNRKTAARAQLLSA